MENKMKIICFLFDLEVGGPTIRARSVYSKMISDGYEVRIAFPKGDGSASAFIREANIDVDQLSTEKPVLPRRFFKFLKFVLLSPIALFTTVRYLRIQKPDVVHVNGAFDVIPAVAARLAGTSLVWHLNDTIFSPMLSKGLGKLVGLLSNVVVTAAERVAHHYEVTDFENRITIHAPVDISRFNGKGKSRSNGDSSEILLIGNWNWIKGQDRFVNVIDSVLKQGCQVHGSIAGRFLEGQKSYWEPILEDIKDKNLDDKITAHGFVSDTMVLLENADVLVLTSHSEASPICVLEAMAMGVPVVVFDVGGVKEMIGVEDDTKAGIVVEEGNVAAMAKEVVRILTDHSAYERCSKNGIQRAVERFSLEKCVELHRLAYDKAVSNHPRGEAI